MTAWFDWNLENRLLKHWAVFIWDFCDSSKVAHEGMNLENIFVLKAIMATV